MAEHFFTFGEINSQDFGVWISGSGTYNAPAKDVTVMDIPGRNGTIMFDNGRWENITLTYPAFISRHFQPRIDDFRAAMASQVGYQRLEDTYHPDEFRLALFKGGLSVSPTTRNLAGNFDVTFDCKPQRFLKLGEVVETWPQHSTIYNPTRFDALPLIRVYGIGNFTLNGVTMNVSYNTGQWLTIDCDTQNAYRGTTNCNSLITYDFPVLSPGANTLTHNFHTFEMIPRFWTL